MNELKYTDLTIGSGVEISKGALVFCHYTGKLDDGTQFDSSYNHGRPFEFVVGSARVIKGLSLGVLGMNEGGKRLLHIPAHLAYGERSVGKFITPNSNLNFEIEVLEVRPRE